MLWLHPTPTRRLLILMLLFLLALTVRTFRAVQEPIINPDAIRYIMQAQLLPTDPLTAIRSEIYHPLHSAAALLAHSVIHNFFQNDRDAWLASVKLVGILAGAIIALQIVALSRLFGAPFWYAVAAALFWILGRRTSYFGADGLSDTLTLVLMAASLITAFHALRFRKRSLTPFFVSGIFAGLAYLARPEGIFATVLLVLTLFLMALLRRKESPGPLVPLSPSPFKFLPRRPLPFRQAAAAAFCLLLGTAIPAIPYMLATGSLTPKESKLIKGSGTISAPHAPTLVMEHYTPLSAAGKVIKEISETLGPAPFVLLIVTFVVSIFIFKRLWLRPRLRLVVFLWIVLWTAVMFAVVLRLGYLDGRHTLILTLPLHALLALAFLAIARGVRYWQARRFAWVPACLVILALVPGVTQLFIPPRNDKRYIRTAADWVAQNTPADTVLCDAEQLVGYYSNHTFVQWLGVPDDPRLETLAPLCTNHPHVLLAYRYQSADRAAANIGPYQAIKSFPSAANQETLTLYALPGGFPTTRGNIGSADTLLHPSLH